MRRLLLALVFSLAASTPVLAQSAFQPGVLSADGNFVALDVSQLGQGSIDVRGTFAGTIQFEVSTNGINYVSVDCFTPAAPGTAVNSTVDTEGLWQCPVSGVRYLRARMESYASGSARLVLSGSAGGTALVAAAGGGGGGGGDFDIATFQTTFGTQALFLGTQADNLANTLDGLQSTSFTYVYDGATWDRWTGAVTVSGVSTAANQTTIIGHVDGLETLVTTLTTYLQPGSVRIIRSDGVNNDDETEVKATAGVLLGISGRNSSADTNAFVRCINNVAASVTPGTTAVDVYEMILPFGGGFTDGAIGPGGVSFSTGLTCYVATGEAATDATDAAADDVVVNVIYR